MSPIILFLGSERLKWGLTKIEDQGQVTTATVSLSPGDGPAESFAACTY